MNRATEIWSLKENHPDKSHKYLVVSFLSNTRIMQMSNEALEDVSDSCGLDTNAQTLFVTKLIGDSSNLVVQITETSVIICKLDSTIKLCQWDISDGPIICGYAVEEQVIVATKGGILVLLNILIAENAYVLK